MIIETYRKFYKEQKRITALLLVLILEELHRCGKKRFANTTFEVYIKSKNHCHDVCMGLGVLSYPCVTANATFLESILAVVCRYSVPSGNHVKVPAGAILRSK